MSSTMNEETKSTPQTGSSDETNSTPPAVRSNTAKTTDGNKKIQSPSSLQQSRIGVCSKNRKKNDRKKAVSSLHNNYIKSHLLRDMVYPKRTEQMQRLLVELHEAGIECFGEDPIDDDLLSDPLDDEFLAGY